MRKVTLANSLGRSLPLTTSVVMAAQQQPDTINIGGEEVPAGELVVLQSNRNQRRFQRKALLRAKG